MIYKLELNTADMNIDEIYNKEIKPIEKFREFDKLFCEITDLMCKDKTNSVLYLRVLVKKLDEHFDHFSNINRIFTMVQGDINLIEYAIKRSAQNRIYEKLIVGDDAPCNRAYEQFIKMRKRLKKNSNS